MQETTKVLLNWSLLGETRAAIRKHGIRFPYLAAKWLYYRVLNVWYESQFDRKFNVRTGFIVSSDDLDFDDLDVQSQAGRYRPTPPFTIIQGLKKLRRLSGRDFSEEGFIDYGCGAGRVLIIAAELGFVDITGIELSPSLVETCKSNIGAYAPTNPASKLTVIKRNAMEYVPPTNATVFFFFVPFGADIYRKVMVRIRESIEELPRVVYIVDIGSKLRSFDFEVEGCELMGTVEKLSLFKLRPSR